MKLVLSALVFICFLLNSCQKNFTGEDSNNSTPVIAMDDNIKVSASVNGVVLNEANVPISGATVYCGGYISITNSLGIFYFKNVLISKNNGSVSVIKSGYFNATRCFITSVGKEHHLKIQLLAKTLSGTLNSTAGGIIALNGGAAITFPRNAFVSATGIPYNGTVGVAARWINPIAPNMPLAIPGDLRGIRKDGSETMLSTYGMVGAELLDNAGNLLKLATGINAEISFPIPASLLTTAPSQIPLWHFDEVKARWIEEGTAEKNGNVYKANVNKFSFWNVDLSLGFVQIQFTLVDSATNQPLGNQYVSIKQLNSTNNASYGFTNSNGYIVGGVPSNVALQITLTTYSSCGTVIYTRNIGPFAQTTNLDTIKVNTAATPLIFISGNILNCGGSLLANSYFSFYSPSYGAYIIEPDSIGHFSFVIVNCPGTPLLYSYQATNNITQAQSPIITNTSTGNQVNLGNIYACNTQPLSDVYVAGSETNNAGTSIVKVWKNGIATNVSNGPLSCYSSSMFITPANDIYVAGNRYDSAGYISSAVFWKNNVQTYIAGGGSDAYAMDIFVNGTDVYVAYFGINAFTGISSARVLKNGTSTVLSNGITDAYANSIYVSATDVYVGGSQKNAVGKQVAVIWKNGTAINLSAGLYDAQVNKILVSGQDVYAVGQEKNTAGNGKAVVWKNGIVSYLTDGVNNDAMANGIFVDGTDIYVCGRRSSGGSGEKAQLWKNGIATVLSANGSNGIAHSVYVKNNDVYVAEEGFINGPVRLWKNNIPTNLTTGGNFNSVQTVIVK